MPVVFAEKAKDRGTYPVTVAFFDSAGDGEPVTPSAATWTLLGRANQVINGRDAVTIDPLNETVTIVLGPDDLDYADGDVRFLIVESVYDSTLGNGLVDRDQATFFIVDIREKAD